METVLITGANGSLGARLIKEYIDKTDFKIFALVRGASLVEALNKMNEALDFWDIYSRETKSRLYIFNGDVKKENFGLPEEDVKAIKKEMTMAIHAASVVRLDMNKDEARENIVEPLKKTYGFCKSCENFKRFGFVSTLEVVGDYKDLVKEEFLTNYKRNFLNTYESAKFEAEEYLKSEIEKGSDITVFRPSMIVGESTSGKTGSFQSYYMMLERLVVRPVFRVLPGGCPVDTTPIDIVAGGIRALMDYEKASGEVYHFIQGMEDYVDFGEFISSSRAILNEMGLKNLKPVFFVSPHMYRIMLKVFYLFAFGNAKRVIKNILIFIDFFTLRWKLESKKTRATLKKLGIEVPKFRDYEPKLIAYYIKNRGRNSFPV